MEIETLRRQLTTQQQVGDRFLVASGKKMGSVVAGRTIGTERT